MPPPDSEAVEDAETEAFGGGPVELSVLPIYPDHTARHIRDGEVSLVGFILTFIVIYVY